MIPDTISLVEMKVRVINVVTIMKYSSYFFQQSGKESPCYKSEAQLNVLRVMRLRQQKKKKRDKLSNGEGKP